MSTYQADEHRGDPQICRAHDIRLREGNNSGRNRQLRLQHQVASGILILFIVYLPHVVELGMGILFDAIWEWLPQFARGDLPTWIAVAIALIAMLFAIRKPPVHSELNISRLHFDDDGGPISQELGVDNI